jgi:hypothetical protein
LNYLKGYVTNSTDQTAWKALTASGKTLYLNYVRSEDDVILEATGTNMQLNIGDDWKEITKVQINIGDSWKNVTKAQVNIGDEWKTIF